MAIACFHSFILTVSGVSVLAFSRRLTDLAMFDVRAILSASIRITLALATTDSRYRRFQTAGAISNKDKDGVLPPTLIPVDAFFMPRSC
ncbi:hypothetical protein B0T22DRAFT_468820 [Podospora appendiculata]|uniref:Uncharacterized protein n=1 Tax=Podospora appendiculata TaxID=314037 RepID=A0AAE1C958_9PEZI|nr:hypothetical protein B0T22DRAFT_468820 [Podospora appendiculata]